MKPAGTFDWREATLSQLYEIAYHDEECGIDNKSAAAEEIRRRKQAQADRAKAQQQVKLRRKRA